MAVDMLDRDRGMQAARAQHLAQQPLEPGGSVDELMAERDARQAAENTGREGCGGRRGPCVRQRGVKSEHDRQRGHRRARRRCVEQHQHRHCGDKDRDRVEQCIEEPAIWSVDAVEIFVRQFIAEQVDREQRDARRPDPDAAPAVITSAATMRLGNSAKRPCATSSFMAAPGRRRRRAAAAVHAPVARG